MGRLSDRLNEYAKSDVYPFHMPGHKRNMKGFCFEEAFSQDITEIEGFDNLHDAQDVILSVEQSAAELYGSEETHLLVNGSTVGILCAVAGCVSKGGTLLLARNSHKAVYNALYLNELKGIFVYPEILEPYGIAGSISPKDVKESLDQHPETQAVFITSPTYDGVISNIQEIAEVSHQKGVPLIVDEAHGAHLGFYKPYQTQYHMESAIRAGADIVIQSLHKTLPSFTQTSLIHINGTLVNREKIRNYLRIYQSSSPSYVFMAGMDQCFDLIRDSGERRFSTLASNLEGFNQKVLKCQHINVIMPNQLMQAGAYGADPGKLLISARNCDCNGKQLYDTLREKYHIQMEMAAGDYCLGIATIMDTEEGFRRLADALNDMDDHLAGRNLKCGMFHFEKADKVMEIAEAVSMDESRKETILLKDSANRMACDYVYVYPPGIPMIAPGERISESIVHSVGEMNQMGLNIAGLREGKITVGRK